MEAIAGAIRQMINISDQELNDFLKQVSARTFKRNEILSKPDYVPNDIFFIVKGLIRVTITDNTGVKEKQYSGLSCMAYYSYG